MTLAVRPSGVGVVIPTYNSAGLVSTAIESVLSQEPPPRQVVVVDDGSTDGTGSVLETYAPRVTCIRQPNRGPSAARNVGLACVTAETVTFLDADDFLLPGALARRLALMEDPRTVWAHTDGFLQYGPKVRRLFSEVFPRAEDDVHGRIFRALLCRNFITTDAVIARRESLLELGGFDEGIRGTEDWDLWLRLAARFTVRYDSCPTFVQCLGPNTLSRERKAMTMARFQTLIKMQRLFPTEVSEAGRSGRRSIADAHNGMAFALARQGRWHEAASLLRISVGLCPVQRKAWQALLRCAVTSWWSPGPTHKPANVPDLPSRESSDHPVKR